MGGRYEWARGEQRRLADACSAHGRKVNLAQRYSSRARSPLEAASYDIRMAQQSAIGVFSGDCPELDAGSAALLGLMYALGRPIVFQYTSDLYYSGQGGQTMRVNLMVERAATYITRNIQNTIEIIYEQF
jgi:hypothetical protein